MKNNITQPPSPSPARSTIWLPCNPYRVVITQYMPALHQPGVISLLTIWGMIAAGWLYACITGVSAARAMGGLITPSHIMNNQMIRQQRPLIAVWMYGHFWGIKGGDPCTAAEWMNQESSCWKQQRSLWDWSNWLHPARRLDGWDVKH